MPKILSEPLLPPMPDAEPNTLPPARCFRSGKTYGHDAGFSCCFRQWRAAHSHCRFLHGYALSISLTFIARALDKQNWVMDFGGLKPVKAWLAQNFDHKILLAEDDPAKAEFLALAAAGGAEVNILPHIGCEAFAFYIWQHCDALAQELTQSRVRVERVLVREHGGNSASYMAENLFPPQPAKQA